ncbi:MAG TPA: hypothetical protein VHD91_10625 [Gaiellaceae bacterium]|nr:hypothetical protein [Gaiellaceae bacterium]
MTETPDRIVVARHRDLAGRRAGILWRRAALTALTLFLVAGLVNVFGQRPGRTTVDAPAASLELYAPSHLRGGLLYEARFTIHANRTLKRAVLVLSPGWNEGTQVNTIEPSPVSETSSDGRHAFALGRIRAGSTYRLFMEFQVNPTNVGRRDADVWLYDGDTRVLSIDRDVTVFP